MTTTRPTITVHGADHRNPSAVWTSFDRMASARVYKHHGAFRDGKQGWSYYLSCPTDGRTDLGVGHTFARPDELIYTPTSTTDPLDVLETLSSFLGAWSEAQRYDGSENADLFPADMVGMCDYSDELSQDIDWHKDFLAGDVIRKHVGVDPGSLFPSFAWPGGYRLAYYTDDGEMLCGTCVNESGCAHFTGDHDGWLVIGADVLEESETDEHCAHCHVLMSEGYLPSES